MTNSPVAAARDPTGLRWGRWSWVGLNPAAGAVALILLFSLLRLACMAFVGLGTDESYTVAVARDLHLSYFDHPPIQYWIAHALEPAAGVGRAERLPFILMFAGSSWLMFRLGARLFGERAGLWSALALNLAPFFTLAAGSWVLPDGPLILALLAAACLLAEAWFAPQGALARRPLLAWTLAGLCLGLAGLSKYQAALFCLGLGVFLLTTPRGRRQLATHGPYLGAVMAVAMLIPVLVWNAGHGWASFAFQAGRGAAAHIKPLAPLVAVLGQAALLAPWIFAPMALAAWRAARGGPQDERRWFCLMLAAPPVAVFTLVPILGGASLPHWSMPGWLLVFPLLGALLDEAQARARAWPRAWAIGSFVFLVGVGALAASDAASGWAGRDLPRLFRKGDPTVESIEWTQLRDVVAHDRLAAEPGAFIAALKWNEAGKVDQAVGDLAPVAALTDDRRQFRFRHPAEALVGHDALIIARADTLKARLPILARQFRSVQLLTPVTIGRGGRGEIPIGLAEGRDLLPPPSSLDGRN